MTILAPVARCPRPYCRGWLERRVLHTEEPLGTQAFTCGCCGVDLELRDGRLEPVTRRPQARDTDRPSRLPVFTGQQRGKGRPRKVEAAG